MDEYIERKAALDALLIEMCGTGYQSRAMSAIRFLPAADVIPVRHGKIVVTIENGKMKRIFSCCGEDFTQMTQWMTPDYCPNCGAKIDGKVKKWKTTSH